MRPLPEKRDQFGFSSVYNHTDWGARDSRNICHQPGIGCGVGNANELFMPMQTCGIIVQGIFLSSVPDHYG